MSFVGCSPWEGPWRTRRDSGRGQDLRDHAFGGGHGRLHAELPAPGVFAGKMQATVRQDHLPTERGDLARREHRAATALQAEPDVRVGLIKAMRDPEIRRGMAMLFSVLREIGSVRGPAAGNGTEATASPSAEAEASE